MPAGMSVTVCTLTAHSYLESRGALGYSTVAGLLTDSTGA
jgi:hypothetical protein